MIRKEFFIDVVKDAEYLLADLYQSTNFNQSTNADFEWALKNVLKGTSYEDRVWGDFYFEDNDTEAQYIIFLDGKPAYKAGTCHLAGYPGNKYLGIHSGYYYGVHPIFEGDSESKYLPYYASYRQEDEVKENMFK